MRRLVRLFVTHRAVAGWALPVRHGVATPHEHQGKAGLAKELTAGPFSLSPLPGMCACRIGWGLETGFSLMANRIQVEALRPVLQREGMPHHECGPFH